MKNKIVLKSTMISERTTPKKYIWKRSKKHGEGGGIYNVDGLSRSSFVFKIQTFTSDKIFLAQRHNFRFSEKYQREKVKGRKVGEMSSSAGARSVLGNMTNLRLGPDTGLLRPAIKTHVTGGQYNWRAVEGTKSVTERIALRYGLQKLI